MSPTLVAFDKDVRRRRGPSVQLTNALCNRDALQLGSGDAMRRDVGVFSFIQRQFVFGTDQNSNNASATSRKTLKSSLAYGHKAKHRSGNQN